MVSDERIQKDFHISDALIDSLMEQPEMQEKCRSAIEERRCKYDKNECAAIRSQLRSELIHDIALERAERLYAGVMWFSWRHFVWIALVAFFAGMFLFQDAICCLSWMLTTIGLSVFWFTVRVHYQKRCPAFYDQEHVYHDALGRYYGEIFYGTQD